MTDYQGAYEDLKAMGRRALEESDFAWRARMDAKEFFALLMFARECDVFAADMLERVN